MSDHGWKPGALGSKECLRNLRYTDQKVIDLLGSRIRRLVMHAQVTNVRKMLHGGAIVGGQLHSRP